MNLPAVEKIMKCRKRTALQRLLAPHYCNVRHFTSKRVKATKVRFRKKSLAERKFEEKKWEIALSIENHPRFQQKIKELFGDVRNASFDMGIFYSRLAFSSNRKIREMIQLCKDFGVFRIISGKVEPMEPFSFSNDGKTIKAFIYWQLNDRELNVLADKLKEIQYYSFDRTTNDSSDKRFRISCFVEKPMTTTGYFPTRYRGGQKILCVETYVLLTYKELRDLIGGIKKAQIDNQIEEWKPMLKGENLKTQIEKRYHELYSSYASNGLLNSNGNRQVVIDLHRRLSKEFDVPLQRVKNSLS